MSILVAVALLGTALLAAPVQGAFVTTGSILSGAAFSGWGAAGTYTVTDGSDGGGIQAEQDIVDFHTAIGTTNGGTDPPSGSNPISHFYFRIDTSSTSTSKYGKHNIQMNIGSGAAGQVDHLLQIAPQGAGATPPVFVQLSKYDVTQPVGAFTSGSITAVASNDPASAVFQSGATTRVGAWSGAQQGFEVAIPVAWFGPPIAASGNVLADGSGVQNLFGAVFSSTGNLGAVGTVKDSLNDAAGVIRVLNTNLITGTSTFQGVTATQLAFTAQPQSANIGASLGTITVEIRDGSGTKVATATHDVTMTIGTNPGSATLGGTTTVTAVAGVATFSDLTVSAAGTGYTLVAGAPGLTSATSSTFDIAAAQTASQLGIQTQPSAATAGVVFAQQPVVLIQDSGGGTVTSDSSTQVTAAIVSGSGTLLGTTTQTASSGVVTFTDLKTNTADTITIQFTASGLTSVTSNNIVVSPASADPTTSTATVPNGTVGTPTTITITVRDAFNNPVTGEAANLAVSVTGANTASPSVTETGGGQYTASYTPTSTGTDNVAITLSSTAISGGPYSSTISVGAASQLGIQTQPSSTATAGVDFAQQPVVLVQDASGNTVTTDSTTQVTAAIKTGSGTLLGTTTVTAAGGLVTFTNLKTNTADTITIEFTATGLTAATSTSITVSAASADPTTSTATVPNGTAGSTTTITITVRDAFNNPVTGEAANLAVSVSGANAASPSVAETGGGQYTASYTPTSTGTDNVAITLSSTAISGSPYSSVVTFGTPAKLGIQTQPTTTATAGVVFTQQPVILIQDTNGNTVTTDSSTQVTATIKTGTGTLLGTTTVTAANGLATFTNLKTNTADTITIEFTATGLTAVTSTSITVSAASADPTTSTASVPNGTAGSTTTITITVRDAFNNPVTGEGANLVVSVSGANTASPSVTETGGGQYTAAYTPTSTGTDNVAITLSSAAINGSPFASIVSAGAASALTIQTQPSSTATAGTDFAQQPVVLVKDASGNTVTTDSSTQVAATIKTGNGTLLGTTTVTAANGVATFTNLNTNTADTITIEFTATGLTAVTSNTVTVSAATADASTTTADVPNGTVGVVTTITVTVKDAFGNLVVGAAGLLVIAVTGGNSATPSITDNGEGTYTATYTPTNAGTDTVTITLDGVGIAGSPYTSTVTAGTATKLGIQTQPSATATAGIDFAQQPVVLIQDGAGNTITGDSTTEVTATIKAGTGTLLGTTTVTAANGVATFTNLKTNTADTITLEFTATGLTAVTSNSITVSAAAGDAGETTATVPNGAAGSVTNVTITVRDAFGNLVTGATGSLTVSVTGANTATPNIVEFGDGVYYAVYTPTNAGTDAVAITLGGSAISGSPYSSTVSAGAASKLGIETQPSSTGTAGTEFAQQPVVSIQDTNGNTATGDSTTQVTATIKTGTGTLLGTTTVTASNGVATFTNLKTNTDDNITIEFTATGLTAVTSTSIIVSAATADAGQTTANIPNGTVDAPTSITITVRDAFGNLVTDAAGSLIAIVAGTNIATPSITEAGNGVYTASYTPTLAGIDTVTITLGGLGISGSPYTSTVTAGSPSKLGMQTQPSSTATAGVEFAQQPVVLIQDANGNAVTGDSTTEVAATIKTGAGTLLGTTTVTASNGVATFTNLKTNTADTITLEFTSTGLAAVTSTSITVSAAAANAGQTTATVPNGTANAVTNITITARDAFGNLATGAAGSLAVSVTGANTATPTIIQLGNGIYYALYTPTATGTDSIAITLSGTAISGSPYTSTVTSASASKLGIQTQPSATGTAGVEFAQQPVVLIQDTNGNAVTGDSTTQVTATIKTGTGTLLGTTTVTAANGVATFTNLKTNTADTITLEFTATGLTAVTSTSIAVSAAAANAGQTTATVPNGTVNAATNITITARDAFGNLVTGAAGNLAVSISGANTATPTIVELGNGIYYALYTPTSTGTDSIAITLSGTAISGSPYTSTVTSASASKLGIQTQPSATGTAGTEFAQQPVVLIQDANGNTVTGDSTTQVTATIKTGTGTLLGTTTVTAANGVATFTNLKTNTADTITLEFTATGLAAVTSTSITVSAAAANAGQTTATVPGGTPGNATTITITVKDAFGNLVTGAAGSLAGGVTGSNTATLTITEVGNGVYTATYTPTSPGTDTITLTAGGTAISGSPFTSTVGTIALTITDPTPSSQDTFLRGGGARTITVTGTGFQNGATATISGRNVAVNFVTFVSSTQVKLNITVEPIATPGNRTITITNPDNATASSRGIYLEALPEPSIQPEPGTPFAGQNVTFIDVSTSDDWRASIVLHVWDFGDGNTSTVTAPVHQYAAPGNYTVTLTVTDNRGHSATATRAVTVQTVPAELGTHIIADENTRVEIGNSMTLHQLTTGGAAHYNFTWTGRDLTTYEPSATRTFTTLGSFPIKLTTEDTNGTVVTDEIIVHVYRPTLLIEPETVPAGGQKSVTLPEGSVTMTANASKTPTAHIKVDIGKSPEAVDRDAKLRLSTPQTQAAQYMAVTVFDEHELLDFDRVRLEFTYTATDIQGIDESTLAVWYWNGSAWLNTMDHVGRVMPGDTAAQNRTVYEAGLDTNAGKAWAVVNQPSEYALAGRPASSGGGGGMKATPPPTHALSGSEPAGFDRTVSLTLTAVDGGAHLEWTPSEPFADDTIGYQVWRSMSPWTLVANVDGPVTSYTDIDAPAGAKYKVTYFTGFSFEQGYVTHVETLDRLPGWDPDSFARYDPILSPPSPADAPAAPTPAPAPVPAPPQWVLDVLVFLLIAALAYAAAQGIRIGRDARERLQLRRVWTSLPDLAIDGTTLTGEARKLLAEMRQLPASGPRAQGVVLKDARRMAATFAALHDARQAAAVNTATRAAPPAHLVGEARHLLHTMRESAKIVAGDPSAPVEALTQEARHFARDIEDFRYTRGAESGSARARPPVMVVAAEARHLLDTLRKHQNAPGNEPRAAADIRDEALHLASTLVARAAPKRAPAPAGSTGPGPVFTGFAPSERVDPGRYEDAMTRAQLIASMCAQLEAEITVMKTQPTPLPAYVPSAVRRRSREAEARRIARYERRLKASRTWVLARDHEARGLGVRATYALARDIRAHLGGTARGVPVAMG